MDESYCIQYCGNTWNLNIFSNNGGIMKAVLFLIQLFCLMIPGMTARAAEVHYSATTFSSNRWLYEFRVTATNLSFNIEEVSIFFPLGQYENLEVYRIPLGWDGIVIQPDPNLPSDGFFDVRAVAGGIVAGQSLEGFSILVDSPVRPGDALLIYTIVDPVTFETLESGVASLVPEPSMSVLFIAGLIVFLPKHSVLFRKKSCLDQLRTDNS